MSATLDIGRLATEKTEQARTAARDELGRTSRLLDQIKQIGTRTNINILHVHDYQTKVDAALARTNDPKTGYLDLVAIQNDARHYAQVLRDKNTQLLADTVKSEQKALEQTMADFQKRKEAEKKRLDEQETFYENLVILSLPLGLVSVITIIAIFPSFWLLILILSFLILSLFTGIFMVILSSISSIGRAVAKRASADRQRSIESAYRHDMEQNLSRIKALQKEMNTLN